MFTFYNEHFHQNELASRSRNFQFENHWFFSLSAWLTVARWSCPVHMNFDLCSQSYWVIINLTWMLGFSFGQKVSSSELPFWRNWASIMEDAFLCERGHKSRIFSAAVHRMNWIHCCIPENAFVYKSSLTGNIQWYSGWASIEVCNLPRQVWCELLQLNHPRHFAHCIEWINWSKGW